MKKIDGGIASDVATDVDGDVDVDEDGHVCLCTSERHCGIPRTHWVLPHTHTRTPPNQLTSHSV